MKKKALLPKKPHIEIHDRKRTPLHLVAPTRQKRSGLWEFFLKLFAGG